jgi:hypothetical protein
VRRVLASACLLAGTAVQAAPSHDAFFDGLAALCGKTYEGRIVANVPTPAQADPFEGKRLVMHVRDCSADEIRIPFSVGEDRSRTWIVTRLPDGLRLKHQHLHADGTPDNVSMYGGETRSEGSAQSQSFPADAESKAMFEKEGLAVSVDNTWTLGHVPGKQFNYELTRPGREFRVEFDLAGEAAR